MIKETYYCDVCKQKIKGSFPGMSLYWDNAGQLYAHKSLGLKEVCGNCSEEINEKMDEIYDFIKKRRGASE